MSFSELDALSKFHMLRPPSADDRSWVWAGFTKPFLNRQPANWFGMACRGIAPVPDEPLEIYAYCGKKIPAYLGFDGHVLICSSELVDALQECGASLEINHPVRLLKADQSSLLCDRFRWIKPVRGAGPYDLGRGSSLIWTDEWLKDPINIKAYGIFFDTNTWTGEPVFHLDRSPSRLIMTDPVASRIRECGFPGITVESLPDVGKDLYDLRLVLVRPREHN